MGLFRVVCDIVGGTEGVDRRFEVNNIALAEVFGITIERKEFQPRQSRVNSEDGMRPVVSSTNRDLSGLEPCLGTAILRSADWERGKGNSHIGGENGAEARAIGQDFPMDDLAQDGLEPRRIRSRLPRIDVRFQSLELFSS